MSLLNELTRNDFVVVNGFESPIKIFYKDIVRFDVSVNEYANNFFKKIIILPWPLNTVMNLFQDIVITRLEIKFMDNGTEQSIILYPFKAATNANPTPVFPEVGSIIVPPSFINPLTCDSSIEIIFVSKMDEPVETSALSPSIFGILFFP